MSDGDPVRLVIVMRDHFPTADGNVFSPRKGKLIVQGGHAVSRYFVDKIDSSEGFSPIDREWLATHERKICLKAFSEEHLLEVYHKAQAAGLYVRLIEDIGLTEFDGLTKTCLVIGPERKSKVDPITGDLALL